MPVPAQQPRARRGSTTTSAAASSRRCARRRPLRGRPPPRRLVAGLLGRGRSRAEEPPRGLRRDLAELILARGPARVRLSQFEGTGRRPPPRRLEWAVAWLDRAESLDSTPLSFPRLFSRAGPATTTPSARPTSLAAAASEARASPPASCRGEYLIGTAELADGYPDRMAGDSAAPVAARRRTVLGLVCGAGLCHFDQGRYVDAVGDFNVCTVLIPEFAWPFANTRGLAARPRRVDSRRRSIRSTGALAYPDPTFAEAYGTRGGPCSRRATRRRPLDPGADRGPGDRAGASGLRHPRQRAEPWPRSAGSVKGSRSTTS